VWSDTARNSLGSVIYELGWNFEHDRRKFNVSLVSNPTNLESYRKEFETTIYQIPVLHPDSMLFASKIPNETIQAAKQLEAKQSDPRYIADSRLHGFMSQIQVGLNMYNSDNSSYPATLAALAPKYLPADLYAVMPISQFRYAALGSNCNGYHLGIVLQSPDPTAAHAAPSSVVCPGSATDFSSTDPLMYDVKR